MTGNNALSKHHTRRWLAAIVFVSLLVFVTAHLHSASPVRDKVLEDVQVIQSDGHILVDVHFSFPLRYLSHFPMQGGEELRIRLRPVRVPSSDVDAVFKREAVTPRYADVAAVDEVVYEGDIDGGPYLTLHFTQTATYEVIPGPDYRSLRIDILSLE